MKKSRYLITKELARLTGASSPSVSIAKSRGTLIMEKDGTYDIEHPINKEWIDKHLDGTINGGRPPKVTDAKTKSEREDMLKIRKKTAFADMKLKEHKVEQLHKSYIPTAHVQAFYDNYIDDLLKAVEQTARHEIPNIGADALAAGEVLPEHIEKFTDAILSSIHGNRLAQCEKFEKYKTDDEC